MIVVALLLTFVGWLGKGDITPTVLDKLFGVSEYVLKEIATRIDSGYQRSYVFTSTTLGQDATLMFHAKSDQSVCGTIIADGPGGLLNISIDGTKWVDSEKLSYVTVHSKITKYMRFDLRPGGNMHFMKFGVAEMPVSGSISIKALVLVFDTEDDRGCTS